MCVTHAVGSYRSKLACQILTGILIGNQTRINPADGRRVHTNNLLDSFLFVMDQLTRSEADFLD
jgi:hypothetical protein